MKRTLLATVACLAMAGFASAEVMSCKDCVEVIVKNKGDLVYDPIFGPSVNQRPPLPIAEDACIERDYFDRCKRRANNHKPTDVYVKSEDGRLIRTEAVGAIVKAGKEPVLTQSPGKTGDLTN